MQAGAPAGDLGSKGRLHLGFSFLHDSNATARPTTDLRFLSFVRFAGEARQDGPVPCTFKDQPPD